MANKDNKDLNDRAKSDAKLPKQTPKKTSKGAPKSNKFNIKYLGGLLFKKMARGGANELGSNAEEVNKLNVFPVPDGDTGDNMHMTIESGVNAIENTDTDNLSDVMQSLSRGMLLGARGNSGVILSQFFAGMAKGLEKSKKADAKALGHALEMAVEQAYSSVMTPTEGTILTVAREAVEYAVSRLKPTSTIRSLFGDLVKEMRRSLERTPEILKVLKDAKVVDSGGAGLFYIMDGFNRVLNGEKVESIIPEGIEAPKTNAVLEGGFGPDSIMTYGYCTELLLQLQNSKCNIDSFDLDGLTDFLSGIGDSIVAFKTESIVKIHVHTLTPEKVLEKCRLYGEFLTVKIENMSLQHNETLLKEAEDIKESDKPIVKNEALNEENINKKLYGIVAVCNGDGIEALYRDFGADEIIIGGQTNNPSTNDFLEAFNRLNAENILVFPNNGNIFMAATQAAELYDKAKIFIIPSKNIGSGYVALSSADLTESDPEIVVKSMEEAMSRVTAAYVSPSIRDADLNGVHINKGDSIGIIDKEIVVSEKDTASAACSLIDILLSCDGKSMLTVFKGSDSTEEELKAINDFVSDKYSGYEFYVIDGGQDIYPYIFVAE